MWVPHARHTTTVPQTTTKDFNKKVEGLKGMIIQMTKVVNGDSDLPGQ